MDELYSEYGKLMVEMEILQSKIGITKQAIANKLNKGAESPDKEAQDAPNDPTAQG